MSRVATAASRFFICLNGNRIQGLTNADGERLTSRPMIRHWRPKDFKGNFEDRWITAEDMKEEGITETPKDWHSRLRPQRSGLRSDLFDGCVIEARTVHDAQAQFVDQFGISDYSRTAWKNRSVSSKARLGLVNSAEVR